MPREIRKYVAATAADDDPRSDLQILRDGLLGYGRVTIEDADEVAARRHRPVPPASRPGAPQPRPPQPRPRLSEMADKAAGNGSASGAIMRRLKAAEDALGRATAELAVLREARDMLLDTSDTYEGEDYDPEADEDYVPSYPPASAAS